jgi:5'-deoxynucleotidase YfbR-like HD superfamily hydrolase
MNLLVIMTGGQLRAELLMAALAHDMGEYKMGDIPSPVKRAMNTEARECFGRNEDLAMMDIHPCMPMELSEWEHKLLKTCDNLDGLLKCIEEKRMGNYTIEVCGENYAEYLSAQLPALGGGPASELVQLALTEWHWSHK